MIRCEDGMAEKANNSKENEGILILVICCDYKINGFVIGKCKEHFGSFWVVKTASYQRRFARKTCSFLPYLYHSAENKFPHADLAQMVEQLIRNQQVVSSILTVGSIKSRVYVHQKHINPFYFSTIRRIFFRLPYSHKGLQLPHFYPDAVRYG